MSSCDWLNTHNKYLLNDCAVNAEKYLGRCLTYGPNKEMPLQRAEVQILSALTEQQFIPTACSVLTDQKDVSLHVLQENDIQAQSVKV